MSVVTRVAKSNRIILNYHDGTRAELSNDGAWLLRLPYCRVMTGKAANPTAAESIVNLEHNNWIVSRWEAGSMEAHHNFVCPMK